MGHSEVASSPGTVQQQIRELDDVAAHVDDAAVLAMQEVGRKLELLDALKLAQLWSLIAGSALSAACTPAILADVSTALSRDTWHAKDTLPANAAHTDVQL